MKNNHLCLFEVLAAMLLTFSMMATPTTDILNIWLPYQMEGNVTAFETTNYDLLNTTNAEEVFSLDYNNETETVLTLHASLTKGEMYDEYSHTYLRSEGAQILEIFIEEVGDNEIIVALYEMPNGQMVYASCFSLYMKNPDHVTLESLWAEDAYIGSEKYLNYELRSTSLERILELVSHMVEQAEDLNVLKEQLIEPTLPSLVMSEVSYSNQNIYSRWKSTSSTEISALIEGETRVTELESYPIITEENLDLSDGLKKTIETDGLYDCIMRIFVEDDLVDQVYVSDGSWTSENADLEILTEDIEDENLTHYIERQIQLTPLDQDPVKLGRTLLHGGQAYFPSDGMHLVARLEGVAEYKLSLITDTGTYESFWMDLDGNQIIDLTPDQFMMNGTTLNEFPGIYSVIFEVKTSQMFAISEMRFEYVDLSSSVEYLWAEAALIFPNPSQGAFTIKTKTTLLPQTISILNSAGQIVDSSFVGRRTSTHVVSTNLPAGFYYLKYQLGSEYVSEPITIIE